MPKKRMLRMLGRQMDLQLRKLLKHLRQRRPPVMRRLVRAMPKEVTPLPLKRKKKRRTRKSAAVNARTARMTSKIKRRISPTKNITIITKSAKGPLLAATSPLHLSGNQGRIRKERRKEKEGRNEKTGTERKNVIDRRDLPRKKNVRRIKIRIVNDESLAPAKTRRQLTRQPPRHRLGIIRRWSDLSE